MSDFNFKQYNELVSNAPAGLKLWMVESLLKDVVAVTFRYHNPLNKEMYQLLEEVEDIRKKWREAASKRQQNDSSERNAFLDNQEQAKQPTTSADGGEVDNSHTNRVLENRKVA